MKRERIEEIAEILDKRGKMTLEQLEEVFPNVSQMTLRRDLFQLEEDGRIIRIRGGAMSVKEVQKVSGEEYTKKTTINTDAKIVIAQKAAGLIDANSSIFLDGGTMRENLSTASPAAREYFDRTNFEIAIVSATAFTPEQGFSCNSQIESELLKNVFTKARNVYMMLDSSKIGKINPYTFARIEDIDVLITDDHFPKEYKELFESKNIVVM